jgi:hypothetical protein
MRHFHLKRAPALAFFISIFFGTAGTAHCSTYYFLDLTCDLFPFLPIWAVLLAIWPVMLIISRRGRSSIIKASMVIAVMIAVVITLPKAFQISALLFFLLALYFMVDYIVLWKRRNDGKSCILFRMESALLATALSSALIITLICHIPAVLIYRLGSSHSFLVEEWIIRGGKSFDEPLRRALINRGTADRIKVLNLMLERNYALPTADLSRILTCRDEDVELKMAIIRYLGQKRQAESLPTLVTMLAESESSGLYESPDGMALTECLYDAVEAIDRDQAIALIRKNKTAQEKLRAFMILSLNRESYSEKNCRSILAASSPEALLTLLSRSPASCTGLRKDILSELTARRSEGLIVKAAVDIQKKDDLASIPALLTLLRDDDPSVRSAANWALINLTGENFGYDAEGPKEERDRAANQWKSWYKGMHR